MKTYSIHMGLQEHLDAIWRKEAAAMLMWALRLRETWPLIDQEVSPQQLGTLPQKKAGWFSPRPHLRQHSEIAAKRDLMEEWHWRVRTRQIIEEGRPFPSEVMKDKGFSSYDDIVRFSATNRYREGALSEIKDEDYVFFGKAFRDLSQEEYQIASSIIRERHYCLNWLCGMSPGNRWDETPTDT